MRPEQEPTNHPRRDAAPRHGDASTAARRIRVVVVDDHPLARSGFVHALNRGPAIEVVGDAGDGHTALELARDRRPDVVLLDLRLHGLGGTATLRRLAAEVPGVRVLVVSASADPVVIAEALSAGAVGFLTKRTTGHELREAVVAVGRGGVVVAPEIADEVLRGIASEGASRPELTPAEIEVLRGLAAGLTDKQIAGEVHMSPRSVQMHVRRIKEKVGVRRRAELVRWAVEHAIAERRCTDG